MKILQFLIYFSENILRDNKSPKTFFLELFSGDLPNSKVSLLFQIAQSLKRKKGNFFLDLPRCTDPAHHETSDQKLSPWSCSSIHLSEFTICVVLHPATRIHNGGTWPFIVLSYLCGGNSAHFFI